MSIFTITSWHAAWKGVLPGYETCDPKIKKIEKKYYVTFLNSEGDAGNWAFGLARPMSRIKEASFPYHGV